VLGDDDPSETDDEGDQGAGPELKDDAVEVVDAIADPVEAGLRAPLEAVETFINPIKAVIHGIEAVIDRVERSCRRSSVQVMRYMIAEV
jgi:hypothetical protein